MRRKKITFLIHIFFLVSVCLICNVQAHTAALPIQEWNSELTEAKTIEKETKSTTGFTLMGNPQDTSHIPQRHVWALCLAKTDYKDYPHLSIDPQITIHAPPLSL